MQMFCGCTLLAFVLAGLIPGAASCLYYGNVLCRGNQSI